MNKSESRKRLAKKVKLFVYWNSVPLLAVVTCLKVLFYDVNDVYLYLHFGSVLVIAFGILGWLYWDSKEWDVELSFGFGVFTIIMGPIMLLTYYLRTKEFKEALKLLFGLALYLPYYGAHYASTYVVTSVINHGASNS